MAGLRVTKRYLLIGTALLGLVLLSGCGGSVEAPRVGNVEISFVDAANPSLVELKLTGQITLAGQSAKLTAAKEATFTGVNYGNYSVAGILEGYQIRPSVIKVDQSRVQAEVVLVPENDLTVPTLESMVLVNADDSTAPLFDAGEVFRLSGLELNFSEFVEPTGPSESVITISSAGETIVLGPTDWLLSRHKLTLSPSYSYDSGAQSFPPRWEPGVEYTISLNNLVDYSGNPFPAYGFTVIGSPDLTKPAAVSQLSGRSTELGQQILVEWQPSVTPNLWGYQLLRRDQDQSEWTLLGDKPLLGTSYLDDGLTNGIIYEYKLRAIDLNGNLGIETGPVSATPASPNRGIVAFSSDRQSLIDSVPDFDLYVKFFSAGGTEEAVRVGGLVPIGTDSNEDCPAWSPDGRRLAYTTTNNAANPELYVAEIALDHNGLDTIFSATATSCFPLSFNGDTEASPTWSPDGRRLAYIWYSGSGDAATESSLMVIDAKSGSLPWELVNTGQRTEEPDWRPQGDKIAYCTEDDGVEGFWEIQLVDVNTKSTTTVIPVGAAAGDDRDPAFSPDGSRIAFSSTRGYAETFYQQANIWVMDLDGGNAFKVTTSSAVTDSAPVWSPDGTQLIFTRETDSTPAALYRVAATPGATPQLLEATPRVEIPNRPAGKNWLPACAK